MGILGNSSTPVVKELKTNIMSRQTIPQSIISLSSLKHNFTFRKKFLLLLSRILSCLITVQIKVSL